MTSPQPDHLPLALTMGEPSGIGPDITLAAWAMRHDGSLPPFVLVGDADVIRQRASDLGLANTPIETIGEIDLPEAVNIFANRLPVLDVEAGCGRVSAGAPDSSNAHAVLGSIETAVRLTRSGQVGGVVTNPIQKETLYEAGFQHPGHTEFLGALAAKLWGANNAPVMMLAGGGLRVVPATIHIPLRDVPERLTQDLIASTVRTTAIGLRDWFGISAPRLAVAGLNPHAGEGGTIGHEDARIVAPAIEALSTEGLDVRGPLPADTMFHSAARETYDAAICMYHDQALIPVKTLAFDTGVNVTLGLPFVRTSPDHGTALDIAGAGKASPASLIEALKMASSMAQRAAHPVKAA